MNEMTRKEQEVIVNTKPPKCPDFDEECKDVKDHIRCFIGGKIFHAGIYGYLEQAKGYCPFCQNPN